MNIISYPIKPIRTEKLLLTNKAVEVSTRSQPCILSVVSGNAYVAGKRDGSVNAENGFILKAGDELRFFGDVKLCSDAEGADVRLLYYDVV